MKWIFAALGGAVVGAAVFMLVENGRPPALPTLSAAEVRAIVQAQEAPLQDRLDQLMREVQSLSTASAPAREVVSTPSPASPPSSLDLGPITSRIDTLEAKLDHLINPVVKEPEQDPAARKRMEEMRRVAMDRGASEKERLDALRTLRGMKTEDGQDALSHDVVVSLLDIGEHSDTEDSRVDVYRNLHNTSDPAIRDSMLRALAQDASWKVREKVAQDIDTYLDDPRVESALRRAAENDADAKVQERARKTLAGKK